MRADGDLHKRRIYYLRELFWAPQVRYTFMQPAKEVVPCPPQISCLFPKKLFGTGFFWPPSFAEAVFTFWL